MRPEESGLVDCVYNTGKGVDVLVSTERQSGYRSVFLFIVTEECEPATTGTDAMLCEAP